MSLIRRLIRDDRGLETVEWTLAAVLVLLTASLAISILGSHMTSAFNRLINNDAPADSAGGTLGQ